MEELTFFEFFKFNFEGIPLGILKREKSSCVQFFERISNLQSNLRSEQVEILTSHRPLSIFRVGCGELTFTFNH